MGMVDAEQNKLPFVHADDGRPYNDRFHRRMFFAQEASKNSSRTSARTCFIYAGIPCLESLLLQYMIEKPEEFER